MSPAPNEPDRAGQTGKLASFRKKKKKKKKKM